MNIQLSQPEIEKAIILYITNQGIDLDDKSIEVEMTAGRKGNGHTAQVTILGAGEKTSSDEESDPAEVSATTADGKKLF